MKLGDMINSKAYLRREYKNKRNALTEAEVKEKSRMIAERIRNFALFQNAQVIGAYAAIHNEVDLREVLQDQLGGKKIAFPIIVRNTLLYFSISSYQQQLRRGSYDILEPDSSICPTAAKSDLDIIFVPGLVFDTQGNRLGYGKGYYDRFLQGIPAVKIGIAYDFQIVQTINSEEHDIPMNFIITEKRIIT